MISCQGLAVTLWRRFSVSLSSYNDEGIWNWNTHDGDWIYQVRTDLCVH